MDYAKLKAERHRANLELVATLKAIVDSYQGEQRFGQILRNCGFVNQISDYDKFGGYNISWQDEFNLEPSALLERVRKETSKVF